MLDGGVFLRTSFLLLISFFLGRKVGDHLIERFFLVNGEGGEEFADLAGSLRLFHFRVSRKELTESASHSFEGRRRQRRERRGRCCCFRDRQSGGSGLGGTCVASRRRRGRGGGRRGKKGEYDWEGCVCGLGRDSSGKGGTRGVKKGREGREGGLMVSELILYLKKGLCDTIVPCVLLLLGLLFLLEDLRLGDDLDGFREDLEMGQRFARGLVEAPDLQTKVHVFVLAREDRNRDVKHKGVAVSLRDRPLVIKGLGFELGNLRTTKPPPA